MNRLLSVLLLGPLLAIARVGAADDFAAQVAALQTDNFEQKAQIATSLAASGNPRAAAVLTALLDGKLYQWKHDNRLIIAETADANFVISDAASGEALGEAAKRDLKRVAVNNALRGVLRDAIAQLSVTSADPQMRLKAIQQMDDAIDPARAARLEQSLDSEQDPRVRAAIAAKLALAELANADPKARMAAVQRLGASLDQDVRKRIGALRDNDPDLEVRAIAAAVLAGSASKLRWYEVAETVFFGVSLGSVLLLAAIGLAITFGVMGVINMAHGELMMLGAYTAYLVQQALPRHLESSLALALPLAFLLAALVGVAIERGVIRFLYGRPLETLLATFGISLLLQQFVRTTISTQNVPVANPSWMSGSWVFNNALSITYNRLYILLFSLTVFSALVVILKRTALGLQVRAVTQNRAMARAMGVRAGWVDALTFGLGSGIAGIAGVALSQLTNVGPNLGQSYIIDSFMVVVFGGVGNLWGTLLGSLALGVANKFMEPWAGAVLAKIMLLVLIILFIQKRPGGLFPQRGRAAEA
ncbi:MAG: urea ABC transporter permease subunit UrtB [Gammaproteobacteria bacterium]